MNILTEKEYQACLSLTQFIADQLEYIAPKDKVQKVQIGLVNPLQIEVLTTDNDKVTVDIRVWKAGFKETHEKSI